MADVFDIIPKQTSRPRPNKQRENVIGRYTQLQGEFLSQNYGYYTHYFIRKIEGEAIAKNSQIEVLSGNRILRDLVRKYMLSDLELVFLGHVSEGLEWNFNKAFFKQHSHILPSSNEQHKGIDLLTFFLNLVAFFVKSYVGQLEEAAAIADFLSVETEGAWEGIYEEWLRNIPTELFSLSPRAINILYSNYARDCQKNPQSRNYNAMVDRVLQLSTTYSMMPGEAKQERKRQLSEIPEQSSNGRKMVKKNIITEGAFLVSGISKRQESSMQEPILESRMSNSFLDMRKEDEPVPKQKKKTLLKLKTKNQPVTNHVSEFYSKKQYQSPAGREEFRPESTIGFQNSGPSFLDFNNRSSVYEAIPYTLKNNSNLSSFWK